MRTPSVKRRTLFQVATILFLILLAALMFLIGKQHTLLLDNQTIELNQKSYQALSLVEVAVDKQPFLELAARDRDKALVKGQRHTITVRYTDKAFEEHVITKKVKLSLFDDMLLISIPALVAQQEQEVWMQLFIPPTAAVAPQEESIATEDDLSGLGLDAF
ncbi:MAG: DUF6672 family protein [Sphaerochaetaceae bacterium]